MMHLLQQLNEAAEEDITSARLTKLTKEAVAKSAPTFKKSKTKIWTRTRVPYGYWTTAGARPKKSMVTTDKFVVVVQLQFPENKLNKRHYVQFTGPQQKLREAWLHKRIGAVKRAIRARWGDRIESIDALRPRWVEGYNARERKLTYPLYEAGLVVNYIQVGEASDDQNVASAASMILSIAKAFKLPAREVAKDLLALIQGTKKTTKKKTTKKKTTKKKRARRPRRNPNAILR